MESAQIARRFLSYFEHRGHMVLPSASLVAPDPALPLTGSGMAPLRPCFLGEREPPARRVASVQKCLRARDIEKVGTTTRHASFFQMLGNSAFGDYAEDRAIEYAWELLTRPERDGGFGFQESRLWVTVHDDDAGALAAWRGRIGMPGERIQRRGMRHNLWSMGVPGPCGPSSEIFYDRGPEYGADGGPAADEDRYLGIWNLVWPRQMRGPGPADEGYPVVGELPVAGIHTGMGLERMAAILQGVDNIHEIDTTWKVLDRAAELTGCGYGRDAATDAALRVIADHMRAAVMLAADGAVPGDEAQGYVLRRLLRRNVRNLRLLAGGQRGGGRGEEHFCRELAGAAIEALGEPYPELVMGTARITAVIDAEEESFLGTLGTGTAMLEAAVEENKRRGCAALSGEQAVRLHGTYGFPIDLTVEMAAEHGLAVDAEEFGRLVRERAPAARAGSAARPAGDPGPPGERSRIGAAGEAGRSVFTGLLGRAGQVTFTGYDTAAGEAVVIGLLAGGAAVPAASEGTEVEVVLDRTPFYAEGGGQLADAGLITAADGGEVEVFDVQAPVAGLIVHRGKIRSGEIRVGAPVYAKIDVERRRAISRSHTATHLVHRAFRGALGESAAQAGSENAPGRFRLDFTAAGPVPPSVLRDVEDEVNEVLVGDLEVRAFHTSVKEARAMGAVALFGEKYGDRVRVVEVGDYSRELCGGTHVARSGQLGLIKLLGDSSIGAGVRRVEALVGLDAFRFLAAESVLVAQLTEQLKARPEELPERVAAVISRLREAERDLRELRAAQLLGTAGTLAGDAADVGGTAFVAHRVADGIGAEAVRELALDVRGKLAPGRAAVVVLAGVPKDRPVVVVAVNDAARAAGLKAGALVGIAARLLGGGGGGRDDVAQGGGGPVKAAEPDVIDAAFDAVRCAVRDIASSGSVA